MNEHEYSPLSLLVFDERSPTPLLGHFRKARSQRLHPRAPAATGQGTKVSKTRERLAPPNSNPIPPKKLVDFQEEGLASG